MKKMRLNLRKVVAIAICLAGVTMFFGCSSGNDDEPQFKIVRLDFTNTRSTRPTISDVQNALSNGADSIYLVSTEDFDILTYGGIYSARDDALKLTGISPRVRGKNIINPTHEAAASIIADEGNKAKTDFEACGFKYIPGYVKTE